jgi:vancomycin resistance protein YoaR
MNADIPKAVAAKPEAAPAKSTTKVASAKRIATAKPASKAAKKPAAAKKTPVAKKIKKEAKVKVVRDSFTMPQPEYQKIADIKAACLKTGMHVKKSEILRAGLQALAALSVPQLKAAIDKLDKIATGRPKKH